MEAGGRCLLARIGGPVVAGEDTVGHPVLDKVAGLPPHPFPIDLKFFISKRDRKFSLIKKTDER
ncbi:hypothetical protein KY290_000847 [Solanum tuberosum]|uniref:Uncharacterized protein n=1 Tax=Solanum tuberosum TaxID=4113 RepID=A0ABQ7WKH2_SOLTU|nr:hypothetical protein KY289_000905 [Solanum tuberosum]KAH0781249.1 hypothetical protein KY290_000847 [Solanum tuberosum]